MPTAASEPARQTAPYLSQELWETIQDSVPIVCVDLVPVRLDVTGAVTDVGFIRRTAPFRDGLVWCHVGGRVNLGESVAEAMHRHLIETLGPLARSPLGPDPQPDHVAQYFREQRPDAGYACGWDPRKHAVSLTFVVPVPEGVAAVAGGEGVEFRWIPLELLAAMKDTWPGSMTQVRAALAGHAARTRT